MEVPESRAMSEALVLRRQHRRSKRGCHLVSIALVAPLFLFLVLTLGVPFAGTFWRAIDDSDVVHALPRTIGALRDWDGLSLPDEPVYRLLAADLQEARAKETLALAARRLNYDVAGYRSLLFSTARRLPAADTRSFKDAMIQLAPAWGELKYWGAIKNASGPVSLFFLLSAIDMKKNADGTTSMLPKEDSVFIALFGRTFVISLVVTAICLLLGFPLSYFLTNLPARFAYPMLVLVLVPFWTSLLVRTAAWAVLLQNNGVVNNALRDLDLTQAPLALIYNRVGVYISMTHILLPFFVLPLYSVMRNISPVYMRAAASLGATPLRTFLKIYLPQCAPGVSAGCLLVFTIAIGFYVTPALVGGADDQMISYYIAFYTNTSANWGLACALSVWLLVATLLLYWTYSRLLDVVPGSMP
jgi:putative spermidine/putrescine transport system permease protein